MSTVKGRHHRYLTGDDSRTAGEARPQRFGSPDEPVKPLLVLGTRKYALEVCDVLEGCPGLCVVGFVENMDRSRTRETISGLPIHWVDDVEEYAADHWAICSLSTTHRWKFTEQIDGLGMPFATAVHETAYVSSKSILGAGCRIGVRAVIAACTRLGRHVSLNRCASIGHHTEIEDYCTIQPGANIAGNCRIGRGTYIGMGANVVDGVAIGAHSVIGAGSVVTKDIPERTLALGVPARIIQQGIQGQ